MLLGSTVEATGVPKLRETKGGRFMTLIFKCKLAVIVGLATLIFAAKEDPLWASAAGEQVKSTIDEVMATLRDPKLEGADKKAVRREKLRQVILPRFDFAEMAKRALGNNWNRYPDRQSEFVNAFTQLLEDSYADQIEMAKGEKIVYLNERTDNKFAEVDTKVISPQGEETPMTYKLHVVESDWKVYDIVVENISIVNSYRAQFNRVLGNASIDDLIKRMREKRAQKNR